MVTNMLDLGLQTIILLLCPWPHKVGNDVGHFSYFTAYLKWQQKKICFIYNELFQKKNKAGRVGRERRGHTFLNSPSSGRVLTLPLEIPDKTRLHPWKIRQIGLFQKKNIMVFQIVVRGWGIRNFTWEIFYQVKRT